MQVFYLPFWHLNCYQFCQMKLMGFSLLFFKGFLAHDAFNAGNCLLLWNPISNQLRNFNFSNNLLGFKLINSQLIPVKIIPLKALSISLFLTFQTSVQWCHIPHPAHGSAPSLSLPSSQQIIKALQEFPTVLTPAINYQASRCSLRLSLAT